MHFIYTRSISIVQNIRVVVLKFILWICECRQKPKIRVVVRSYIQKSHRNRTTVTDSGDSSSSYRIVQAKLLIMDWVCYPCITKWLSNLQLHAFSPISRASRSAGTSSITHAFFYLRPTVPLSQATTSPQTRTDNHSSYTLPWTDSIYPGS